MTGKGSPQALFGVVCFHFPLSRLPFLRLFFLGSLVQFPRLLFHFPSCFRFPGSGFRFLAPFAKSCPHFSDASLRTLMVVFVLNLLLLLLEQTITAAPSFFFVSTLFYKQRLWPRCCSDPPPGTTYLQSLFFVSS